MAADTAELPTDGGLFAAERARIKWGSSVPFFLVHLAPLAAFVTGVTPRAIALGVVLYVVRMFFVTAGYHRYFSHRSFKASRPVQFLLAVAGTTALQKGPIWWASQHRLHHRAADTEADPHTPLRGFWWSHVVWILSDSHKEAEENLVADLTRYRELRLVERFDWVAPVALAALCFLIAGPSGLVIGFFASTVVLWHATFTVNSLAHVFGRRRYATPDTSRNSALIATFTLGEGWHNNHHHLPTSARLGFFWWEIDPAFYGLRLLAALRIVHDLRPPPQSAKQSARIRDGWLDVGLMRAHLSRAAAALSGVSVRAPAAHAAQAMRDSLASQRATLEEALARSIAAVEAAGRQSRTTRRELASARHQSSTQNGPFDRQGA